MKTDEILLGNKKIGENYPPFIIAEMSGNHNQSLERALKIVDAAAGCGVHALKLQTYTADTMTLNINEREFRIDDPDSLWAGKSLYDLYNEAHTPWDWHKPIFDRCKELGIICFSTPFDATAVDFLKSLGNPIYKVASFENTDIPLIRKIASTGKPIIMSTGMASIADLELSINEAKSEGLEDLILLKCTSAYPADPGNINARTIPHLRDLFNVQVGLSDHTMGTAVAVAAVTLGATVIEKHFTLSRSDGGVDSAFSLEPAEMKRLVEDCKIAWRALGQVSYGTTENEKGSIQFKRSLYITADVKKGELLTEKNVRAIRPGFGLPPKYLDKIIGRKAKISCSQGTALSWDIIE